MTKPKPLPSSSSPRPWPEDGDLHDAIRRRAEEIYVRNGGAAGRDLDNWAQAEFEILSEAENSNRRTAIVIKVNGVQYIGEYVPDLPDGYRPGEFGPGVPVPVRIEGDKMFVKRPNGRELETRIVQKIS